MQMQYICIWCSCIPISKCRFRDGVEKDYMTLQMNYQEKYEQGVEQEKIDSAMRMIEDGDLPLEKVAMYSGLTLEQVLELERELQPV